MKYCFTTLAVNEPYFKKSLDFHIKLQEKTEFALFNITTTENDLKNIETHTGLSLEDFKIKYPKLNITTLESFNHKIQYPLEIEGNGFTFNLNLKVLSIKACLNLFKDFDYLFFSDGDWSLNDGFDEKKILHLLNQMKSDGIEFAFERPARIGDARNDPDSCFYANKIKDYNIFENPLWDEAHVVNEQFMVFKNNWKLISFEQKWEQMMWYTIANGIMNYPDGFEIGVAALESSMKWNWNLFSILSECFTFYTKYTNVKHTRF